jgi:hypothetical protein
MIPRLACPALQLLKTAVGFRVMRWSNRFGRDHDFSSVLPSAFFLRSIAAAPAPAIENTAVKGPIGPPPGAPPELPLDRLCKLLDRWAGAADDGGAGDGGADDGDFLVAG